MDGILLDSEPLHYEALRAVLAREGHVWSREANERLLGTTVGDSFRTIAETVPLRGEPESYIPVYDREVLQILSGPLTPAPGVRALIGRLKELGAPMAVASSSLRSWIDATLSSLDISESFDVVVSGEDIANGKPSPEIYLKTADLLAVSPSDCLAIEDAPNGVQSAKAAGMSVIAVRTPYTEHLSLGPADLIVNSLDEVEVNPADGGWSASAVLSA